MATFNGPKGLIVESERNQLELDNYSSDDVLTESPLMMGHIVGIDSQPRVLPRSEIEGFGDVFTRRFILQGRNPATLRELLDQVGDLTGSEEFRRQELFLVAEGGQFAMDRPEFPLNSRLVYVWRNSGSPEMMLSTVPVLDENSSLMQLIAWSETDGAFHFFERFGTMWFWAGSSEHALLPETRGKGPFDSHINGGLVIKELKLPWAHWHSQTASIPLELLRDTDFGKHIGLSQLIGAEVLEKHVKRGLKNLAKSRRNREAEQGVIRHPDIYLSQVANAASVNLVSTAEEFSPDMNGEFLKLPLSFFIDVDGLTALARQLFPGSRLLSQISTQVLPSDYLSAIKDLQIGVSSLDGSMRIEGDTHFCFLVPERAFEDTSTMMSLVKAGSLTAKMAFCIRMVDFTNPVSSKIRSSLVEEIPAEEVVNNAGCLDALILQYAVEPGRSILFDYWNEPNLLSRSKSELNRFLEKLSAKIGLRDGVVDIMKLAESRKSKFRKRDLNEFRSTTSHSAIEIGDWRMNSDAEVVLVEGEELNG